MLDTSVWPEIQAAAGAKGLAAFVKVWYPPKPTAEEEAALKDLFKQFPLGQTNFNHWLKHTVRQAYEGWQRKQGPRQSPLT